MTPAASAGGGTRCIWVVGSGSLAQAVCNALATSGPDPLRVVVVARSEAAAHGIRYICQTRAALAGAPVEFSARALDVESVRDLAEAMRADRPHVTLNAASYQSPWEHLSSPSAWTAFTRSAGIGATLPLQVMIAARVAEAVARSDTGGAFVNAAYPDAVNPVLRALRLPVLCGIGNVGLLAATLRTRLRMRAEERLQVLAHHIHLSPPEQVPEARAWRDGRPVTGVGDLLREQRATPRHLLNPVTGHSAALLLREIASGRPTPANVPGPAGLPGGFPVRITGRRIVLDLPEGMTEEEAVAWNLQASAVDGAIVDDAGRVEPSPRVARHLSRYLPHLAAGYHCRDMQAICDEILTLRDELRRRPVTAHAEGEAPHAIHRHPKEVPTR